MGDDAMADAEAQLKAKYGGLPTKKKLLNKNIRGGRQFFDSGDWAKKEAGVGGSQELSFEHKYPTLANGGTVLFRDLSEEQKKEVCSTMKELRMGPNSTIITQGELGDHFYVLGGGECDVIENSSGAPKKLKKLTAGDSFGELALMYDTPRSASVVTTTDCILYEMDRGTFRRVLATKAKMKREKYSPFLEKVELLKSVPEYDRQRVADYVDSKVYSDGDAIIKCGDKQQVNDFFILYSGACVAKINGKEVRRYEEPGQFFGELALLTKGERTCDVFADGNTELLVLDSRCFEFLKPFTFPTYKKSIDTYQGIKVAFVEADGSGEMRVEIVAKE
eukprot:GFYU01002688.1.p1 GENE.GFYU01002688.1~~GFYU01002688.1.p1  ORF type:complete len:334 (+),score=105.74 GFYU01002688.1:105-1106(+)